MAARVVLTVSKKQTYSAEKKRFCDVEKDAVMQQEQNRKQEVVSRLRVGEIPG
jgi:hypothetical protein